MEPDDAGVTLWYSVLADDGWQPRNSVVSGKNLFVNWADLPSVLALDNDHWAAHWLEMAGDLTYSYHVLLSQSFDAGQTWSIPIKPHRDGTPTEHGFVSLFAQSDDVSAIWLDGRNTGSEAPGDPASSGMTLRAARIDHDSQLHEEHEIDDLVCDCCQTDVASSNEGIVALYRDRTADEIRDISVARLVNGRWLPAFPLHNDNWRLAGCPVNGPAVAAHGARVAAAWFSMPDGHATVRLKFSGDGGASFGEAIDISTDNPVGRVDTLVLADGSAIVGWLEAEPGGAATLRVRRVGPGLVKGPIMDIAKNLPARSTPQLTLAGNNVIIVWTEKAGRTPRIVSARISVAEFNVDRALPPN
jgi:hypothetical protein